jgi:hypothetical protein
MEMAIEMGKSVIVEQVRDKINLNLKSIMKKSIQKHAGQKLINFSRKQYKYDKNFKLYVVCSNILRPSFDVNITNHVTLINFQISLENL